MSIQTEAVSSGGPGLNGLALSAASAVNQSATEAAQVQHHHHHAHDPWSPTYPSYPTIPVPYNASYTPDAGPLPPYYHHEASQLSQPSGSHQAHRDRSDHNRHAQPRESNHDASAQSPSHQANHRPQSSRDRNLSTGPQSAEHVPSLSHPQLAGNAASPLAQHTPTSHGSPGSSSVRAKRSHESIHGSEDEAQQAKRPRPEPSAASNPAEPEAEALKEEEAGPSGGPKHWTDEEKSRLFHWMLDSDERWEAFGTKMNSVFREGSSQLFNSRKSFTALKSCYHRNVEVFKQIYVFEGFLAKAPISSSAQNAEAMSPSSSSNEPPLAPLDPNEVAAMPTPSSFSSATERHIFLERKLEAAKALNIPVSNLTVKVIDHWYDMGWFALFKKRYQEDPKTGLPVPRYAADRDDIDAEGEEVQDESDHTNPAGGGSIEDARRRHLDPHASLIPAPFPNPLSMSRSSGSATRSHRATPPPPTPAAQHQMHFPQSSTHHSQSAQSSPQLPYGYPPHGPVPFYPPSNLSADYQMHQQLLHFQVQTAQSLTHLTNITQTLLGTCTTLVELVRGQVEDIRTQTELLRRREEREESSSHPAVRSHLENAPSHPNPAPPMTSRSDFGEQLGKNSKAALATEVLANPQVGGEVKHAAAEYLKRLFQ